MLNVMMAAMLYGITESEVRRRATEGLCIGCGGPADEFSDDLSRREFGISGLCQACQDLVFCGEGE